MAGKEIIKSAPLAARMRPRTLAEYVGQEEILGPGRVLRRLLDELSAAGPDAAAMPSMLFWGPPGTGKTTLAYLIAQAAQAEFVSFSAVSTGIKEAREVIEDARRRLQHENRRTVLFVDEIHRFNKGQQDALLHAVEEGILSLLGATTENPSFEVNNALLSRCRVFVLQPLGEAALSELIDRAVADTERGLGNMKLRLEPEAKTFLLNYAGGDARITLNSLELAALSTPLNTSTGERLLTAQLAQEILQRNTVLYDRNGEEHYNLISALHKAIRHSDPDAALYYLAVMMEGGESPLFIARRLVRAASEDVGLADPQALEQALAAKEAVDFLGYPECDTALAQATVYLATAPKSNSVYTSLKELRTEIRRNGPKPVPLHYRNAPTQLMKDIGYGHGYLYDHDYPQKVSPQEAMPVGLEGRHFYTPGELGFEKEIHKRLEYFAKIREKLRSRGGDE
ncbi:MAG: replication-associated recombination protein A [Bdellovibrionales bacterium]|nr:replication-associated recombination protein A [Bdellovibrionales bacterium]